MNQEKDNEKVLTFEEIQPTVKKSLNNIKKDFKKMKTLSTKMAKSLKDYVMGEKITEGYYGKIMSGVHIKTGEKVCIKIIEKSKLTKEDEEKLSIEINILSLLKHCNVIQMYSIINAPTAIYIILEYIEGVDLQDYVSDKDKLNESEGRYIFYQILSAVYYLHSLGIAHRDLRLENILIDSNHGIKLIDFGQSTFYDNRDYSYYESLIFKKTSTKFEKGIKDDVNLEVEKKRLLSTPFGNLMYSPPEILKGENYIPHNSEVWSLGIMLYVMINGNLPFDFSDDKYEVLESISSLKIENVSKELGNLLKSMLELDPKKRISMEEIFQSNWMNQNFE